MLFRAIFMVIIFLFGLAMIRAGLRSIVKAKAEAYDKGSFSVNIWASVIMIIVGVVLSAPIAFLLVRGLVVVFQNMHLIF